MTDKKNDSDSYINNATLVQLGGSVAIAAGIVFYTHSKVSALKEENLKLEERVKILEKVIGEFTEVIKKHDQGLFQLFQVINTTKTPQTKTPQTKTQSSKNTHKNENRRFNKPSQQKQKIQPDIESDENTTDEDESTDIEETTSIDSGLEEELEELNGGKSCYVDPKDGSEKCETNNTTPVKNNLTRTTQKKKLLH